MNCQRDKTKTAVTLLTFLALGLTMLISAPVYGQVVGATLYGAVTDQSGGVVPEATISIKNIATGITRASTTNSAGFYSVPNLLPGTYEIRTSAQGFSSELKTGVTLTVGEQQVLNFTLQVGQMTQTVEVTTEAPNVELASSSISATVNSTTVRELPLNGRSWTDLATLQPGVASIQTQPTFATGPDRGDRGFGAQITVAGARPQQNNYRLDGLSISDYANGAPGSVLGGDLGVDAIQEFSVLTSNYSAEYGRTSGGVVNAITRSGTNQFHGGAYEFMRNSALDARNFFDGPKIPPFRRNQFGVGAGGPIRKDRLFVFGDYEGIRQSKGITNQVTVPSLDARGIAPGGTTPTQVAVVDGNPLPAAGQPGAAFNPDPTTHIDVSAEKYLPLWPLPNRGIKSGTNGNVGLFAFAGQQVINENFGTARVDYKITDKDNLDATYLGDITPYSSPDGLDVSLLNTYTHREFGTMAETHTFGPSLVNTIRFGVNRESVNNNESATAINSLAADHSLDAIPGHFASQVMVPGLTPIPGGLKGASYFLFYWTSFQEYDDAAWTHGTHSVKFGGAAERMQTNQYNVSNSSGIYSFGTFSDYFTNNPSRFLAGLTPTAKGLRQTLFGLYVQDDWRALPSLTLNMGLRWEMITVPTEVQNKLPFLTNITDPLSALHIGSPLYSNSTYRNFEPRVGFAWDPFHNGKTAVRGGFGIFDVLPLPYEFFRVGGGYPFSQSGSVNSPGAGTFYTGGAPLLKSPKTNGANYVEQHPHRSYDLQWNLNVQRELAPRLTGFVGYVGSRGIHLPVTVGDLDIVLPTKTSAGYLFPNPVDPTRPTFNSSWGSIGTTVYAGDSFYHALELGIQKAMSHGVQLQGSFTWGRSIDTSSAAGSPDQFSNSISSLPWYDLKSVRGLSDFNISRTLIINGTWQVPSPKSLSGPAQWITNGWELGGIFKVSDGVPFTATFGTTGDPQGLNSSDPWDFPNRLTGPGCATLTNPGNPDNYIKTECFTVPTAPSPAFFNMPAPLGCDPATGQSMDPKAPFYLWCFNLRGNSGRNTLIGPGTMDLDFSVYKNNYIKRISENFNVQFRAEFFNILNRPNFAVPITPDSTDIYDPTGTPTGIAGLLSSTTTTAREIQFALKVNW
jgi:outer membrane receptor protein involved in Fe transport